jgi:hypothetical protein
MRKSPVLTLTVILTLALGIGGNSAAFSVVHALLLKPLQYRDPGGLVEITADYPRLRLWDTTFSKHQFDKVKAEQESFAEIGIFLLSTESLTLSGNGEPEALTGARVSANFLSLLGIQPALGRSFLPEDEARGGPDVAFPHCRHGRQLSTRAAGGEHRSHARLAVRMICKEKDLPPMGANGQSGGNDCRRVMTRFRSMLLVIISTLPAMTACSAIGQLLHVFGVTSSLHRDL